MDTCKCTFIVCLCYSNLIICSLSPPIPSSDPKGQLLLLLPDKASRELLVSPPLCCCCIKGLLTTLVKALLRSESSPSSSLPYRDPLSLDWPGFSDKKATSKLLLFALGLSGSITILSHWAHLDNCSHVTMFNSHIAQTCPFATSISLMSCLLSAKGPVRIDCVGIGTLLLLPFFALYNITSPFLAYVLYCTLQL